MLIGRKTNLAAALADSKLYEDQIEQLHIKYSRVGKLYRPDQNAISIGSLSMNRRRVAKLLAKAVSNGTYEFSPAVRKTVRIKGKERVLYSLSLTDLIVHGVVA